MCGPGQKGSRDNQDELMPETIDQGRLVGGALAAASLVSTKLKGQVRLTLRPGPSLLDSPTATHRFERQFRRSADGLRTYRIDTAVPVRAAPKTGRPSLFALDGNAVFDELTAEQLAQFPDVVLIGIGYDTPLRFDVESRTLDYTPRLDSRDFTYDARRPERLAGGAPAFASIVADVVAERTGALSLDWQRSGIWGHSYGGLFILHLLTAVPDIVSRYYAASPSLWWHDGVGTAGLRREPRWEGRHKRVILWLGEEDNVPEDGDAKEHLTSLLERKGFAAETRILQGASHRELLAPG
jgi:predicted alpha/beta superfamily hydrolase